MRIRTIPEASWRISDGCGSIVPSLCSYFILVWETTFEWSLSNLAIHPFSGFCEVVMRLSDAWLHLLLSKSLHYRKVHSFHLRECDCFVFQNFLGEEYPFCLFFYSRWQVSLKETEVQYFWNTMLLVWIFLLYIIFIQLSDVCLH